MSGEIILLWSRVPIRTHDQDTTRTKLYFVLVECIPYWYSLNENEQEFLTLKFLFLKAFYC